MSGIAWQGVQKAIQDWAAEGSGIVGTKCIWAQQEGPRPSGQYIALRLTDIRPIGHDWTVVEEVPLVIPDDAVESVDAGEDTITLTAHGLATGDGPVRLTTTGTLPSGLAPTTDYWVIAVSANAISLATTIDTAYAETAIALASAGTGAHTLVDTAETVRLNEEIASRVRGSRAATLRVQCFGGPGIGAESSVARLSDMVSVATKPAVRAALNAAGVGIASLGSVQSVDGVLGTSFEARAALDVQLSLTSEVTEFSTFVERLEITNDLTETTAVVEL